MFSVAILVTGTIQSLDLFTAATVYLVQCIIRDVGHGVVRISL